MLSTLWPVTRPLLFQLDAEKHTVPGGQHSPVGAAVRVGPGVSVGDAVAERRHVHEEHQNIN